MSDVPGSAEIPRAAKVQVLRLAALPAMAWKNGGGTTVEYAVFPAGARLAEFDWRVSRARVEAAGPFSIFPGVDRTLAVVDGAGIDLVFADRVARAGPTTTPLPFPADVAVDGRPIAGPIEDLNVMTRRGRWRHRVDRMAIGAAVGLTLDGDVSFVVAAGAVRVVFADGADFDLGPGDALRIEGVADPVVAALGRSADILLVRLDRTDGSVRR